MKLSDNKWRGNEIISLILLLISNFFRGETFFNIINVNFYGVRIQYILIIVSLLLIKKNKIKTKHLLVLVFTCGILLLNYISAEYYDIKYIIYLSFFIILIILWENILKSIAREHIAKTVDYFLIILLFLGIFEIYFNKTIFHYVHPYLFNSAYNRTYLFFHNPNNTSLFLVNLYLIRLFIIDRFNFNGRDIVYGIVIIYILISNASRLSLVLFIFILFYQQVFASTKNYRNLFIGTFGITVLILGIYAFRDNIVNIMNNIGGISSLANDPRLIFFQDIVYKVKSNPLGFGLGSSEVLLTTSAHSIIFQLIHDFGWFGYIFWFIYYFYLSLLIVIHFDYSRGRLLIIYSMMIPIISMQVSRVMTDLSLLFVFSYFFAELLNIKNRNLVNRVQNEVKN